MPKTLIKVDFKTPPEKQTSIHNRWHPDIPMVAYVKPGDEFRVECHQVQSPERERRILGRRSEPRIRPHHRE